MIHNLNNDKGTNKCWCGPAAISMLTGASISKIEKMVLRIRNEGLLPSQKDKRNTVVKGMYNHETVTVLRRLKAKVKHVNRSYLVPKAGSDPEEHEKYWTVLLSYKYPTLRQFVEDTRYERYPYLIQVRQHYMVTHLGFVVDNNHPTPTPPTSLKPKRRVERAWRVITKA